MSPARLRLEDLPKALRDRVRDQLEVGAAACASPPKREAKTNQRGKPVSAAPTPTGYACCRCGQTHPSQAAMERHAHAARHPRYRQVGVP